MGYESLAYETPVDEVVERLKKLVKESERRKGKLIMVVSKFCPGCDFVKEIAEILGLKDKIEFRDVTKDKYAALLLAEAGILMVPKPFIVRELDSKVEICVEKLTADEPPKGKEQECYVFTKEEIKKKLEKG